jgi:hypothetical protein
MNYSVSCECGQNRSVASTEAGNEIVCICGRKISVPPLHILRRQAGQTVETPELLIRVMLESRTLPEELEKPHCLHCLELAPKIRIFRAECERRVPKRFSPGDSSGIFFLAILAGPLWALLAYFAGRRDNLTGDDITFELPVRLCDRCAAQLSPAQLAEAMRRVSVYRNLLEKYPQAIVSLTQIEPRY